VLLFVVKFGGERPREGRRRLVSSLSPPNYLSRITTRRSSYRWGVLDEVRGSGRVHARSSNLRLTADALLEQFRGGGELTLAMRQHTLS